MGRISFCENLLWNLVGFRQASQRQANAAHRFDTPNALSQIRPNADFALTTRWPWQAPHQIGSRTPPKKNLLFKILILENGDNARRQAERRLAGRRLDELPQFLLGEIFLEGSTRS